MGLLVGRRIAIAAVIGLLWPAGLCAQEVQPKVYTPAPIGVNVITLGYAYSFGAVLFDKTIPVDDASAHVHSLTVAYSRSIDIFGRAGRVDVALPFVTGDWEGGFGGEWRTASRTGVADPMFRFALFFVGAPALTKEQFARFQPKTIFGGTLRLKAPIGQYDPANLVNLGSNRWAVSPQVGVSHVDGRLVLEAYVGAWIFSDNNEFLETSTLSQDVLYSFQVHAGYRFRRGFWLVASTRQSLGGATMVDGGDKLAPEANNRVGLTLAVPVGRKYALKFSAATGITATAGNDYTTLAAVWQVVL